MFESYKFKVKGDLQVNDIIADRSAPIIHIKVVCKLVTIVWTVTIMIKTVIIDIVKSGLEYYL